MPHPARAFSHRFSFDPTSSSGHAHVGHCKLDACGPSDASDMFAGAISGCLPFHRHLHTTSYSHRDVVWQHRLTVLPSLRTHALRQQQCAGRLQCRPSRSAKLRCHNESQNGNGNGNGNGSNGTSEVKHLPQIWHFIWRLTSAGLYCPLFKTTLLRLLCAAARCRKLGDHWQWTCGLHCSHLCCQSQSQTCCV